MARRLALATALAASALLLAGCSMPGTEAPQPSATGTATSTGTPTPTDAAPESSAPATPTESATPTATVTPDAGEPVRLACDELISAQQMYEYNSNFSIDEGWTPAAGSRAAAALAYQGVACSWVNDSSKERISVSVAHVRDDTLEALEAERAAAASTAPYGYFVVDGSTGEADAFTNDFWVSIDSKTFFEAADAADLVDDVVAAVS